MNGAERKNNKFNLKKIVNIMITSVLVLILAFNIYNIVSRVVFKIDLPKFFGFANAIIISGSMADEINVDDLIIIKEKDEYHINDIITYKDSNNTFITHRLIEVTETGYITKGDANNTADSEINFSQIEGKVICIIPKAGLVLDFFRTPAGMLLMILVIGLILSSKYITEKISDRKKK